MEEDECVPAPGQLGKKVDCGCLLRTSAPEPPEVPYPATEEKGKVAGIFPEPLQVINVQYMPTPATPSHAQRTSQVSYIGKRSSTGNPCPPSIPVHWRKKVMQEIEKDVALGVLEKLPPNTPSTWCQRLVITRKRN